MSVPTDLEDVAQSPADADLETVSRILLGMSRGDLLKLYEKHNSPESFVEFLAQSISATSTDEAGSSFASALRPIISRGVVSSVERDPETFGRAIAPVMGPALREAVRQSLTEFVRNTEQLLNDSLSVRGLRWRVEALRTGRSFASVALMHSLIYRWSTSTWSIARADCSCTMRLSIHRWKPGNRS